MRTINIKPRNLYVIVFVGAFCIGFLFRHLLAVRERSIELAERAENRKYMEQVLKEDQEDLDKFMEDRHRASANLE